MFLRKSLFARFACAAAFVAGAGNILGQSDPGPRGGPASAGGTFSGQTPNEALLFSQTTIRFREVDSVSGGIAGEAGVGLGPTFNGNSCAQCHAQPALGGSSPGIASKQNSVHNPQVALATLDGATNTVPSFIKFDGPVREARFVKNPDGSPDGGVHGLFTIAGRKDAKGCNLAQPDFEAAQDANNVIFRIPTPTFGLGLVEITPDLTLQMNLASTAAARGKLGIGGRFNSSGNDGTITRFGWKAQNKSLLVFAGEAYNVEQGVSNENFPNERSAVPGCVFNPQPEDATNLTDPDTSLNTGTASKMSSDVVNFALFMQLLAPPAPATSSSSELAGQAAFNSIGCVLCHSQSLTSGSGNFTGMSHVTYHPYSDFAIHHMGEGLQDGVSQGAAGGDEFRTAPLWGVGQRLFFLHDGRTSDLLQAIQAHKSDGSEVNEVVENFNALPAVQKQNILNFLRSL